MVNILRFPGSSKADKPAATPAMDVQALFADESSMVFTLDSALPVLKLPPEPGVAHSGDWTNQELADLYRVEALLIQAGIRLETDRGLTDEDDPWFVFCNPDGEVFVHLARFDGRYLLDSPGLGAPLCGDDFSALVDMFVRHQAATAPSGNVVRFKPGTGKDGVVRLHPAMMMAALIWSLYLASDQFIGTAEAAESSAAADEADYHAFGPDIALPAGERPTYLEHGLGQSETSDRLYGPETRTGAQTGTLVGNSIAASLAAIAASWGLFDPRLSALPELSEMQQSEALSRVILDEEAFYGRPAEDMHVAVREHNSLNEAPATKAETLKENVSHLSSLDGPRIIVSSGAQDRFDYKVSLTLEGSPTPDRSGGYHFDLDKIAGNAVVVPSSSQEADKDAVPSDIQSLLKLAGIYTGETQKYLVGNVKVTATFDIASLGKEAAGLILSQLPISSGSGPGIGFDGGEFGGPVISPDPLGDAIGLVGKQPYIPPYLSDYDGNAKDFVYKFLRESSHVEMIKVDNSIIFVDTTAIDEASDVAMVKSWSLDGSTTVSTIGHADYFAQYFYLDYYLA